MSNQELINSGMKTMDETDQVIERSKKVNSYPRKKKTFNFKFAYFILPAILTR